MAREPKRVLFTCGGTAGHINPAIALAQLTAEKAPGAEFLFVGAERGLEKTLVPKAGYDFQTVHISSFHRSFRPREIRQPPPGAGGGPEDSAGLPAGRGGGDRGLRLLSPGAGGRADGDSHGGP